MITSLFVKMLEDNFAKRGLHVDHDYLPGKHKTSDMSLRSRQKLLNVN